MKYLSEIKPLSEPVDFSLRELLTLVGCGALMALVFMAVLYGEIMWLVDHANKAVKG